MSFNPYVKYHNKWTKCQNGHNHQSKKEAHRCNELNFMQRAKGITGLKTQVPFELKVNDKLICKHIVDFFYFEKDKAVVEDVKGFKTADWIIKHKLFEAIYPEIEYRVI